MVDKVYTFKKTETLTIEYWYDRSNNGGRSWWAAKFDNEGNQIGDAYFAHHKEDILTWCDKIAYAQTHTMEV